MPKHATLQHEHKGIVIALDRKTLRFRFKYNGADQWADSLAEAQSSIDSAERKRLLGLKKAFTPVRVIDANGVSRSVTGLTLAHKLIVDPKPESPLPLFVDAPGVKEKLLEIGQLRQRINQLSLEIQLLEVRALPDEGGYPDYESHLKALQRFFQKVLRRRKPGHPARHPKRNQDAADLPETLEPGEVKGTR